MAGPTALERDLIIIFRSRVADLEIPEKLLHEQHLLRWIRARDGDVSKAEEMLSRHIDWRKENKIDTSLLEWSPTPFLRETYQPKFCGFDSSGSPILLCTFGAWDMRPALARGEKANIIRYKDQVLEKVMQLMVLYENQRACHPNLLNNQEKITQFNCICDWKAFSLRYIMSKEVVEVILEAARSFEANYPETLKAAYNVNCSKVFDVLFKLVKPFLSERTLSKILIYDNNEAKWKGDILKSLPADQVPVSYGGTRQNLWDLCDLSLDMCRNALLFNEVFPDNQILDGKMPNKEKCKTIEAEYKD